MPGAATPPTSPSNLATGNTVGESWVDATTIKLDWADTLPRGLIHLTRDAASSYSFTTTSTSVASALVSVTANRWYDIGCEFQWKSTVAADRIRAQISGVDSVGQNKYVEAASAATFQTFMGRRFSTWPTDSAVTIGVEVIRETGTGTITVGGGASAAIQFWVIDLGPI